MINLIFVLMFNLLNEMLSFFIKIIKVMKLHFSYYPNS